MGVTADQGGTEGPCMGEEWPWSIPSEIGWKEDRGSGGTGQ